MKPLALYNDFDVVCSAIQQLSAMGILMKDYGGLSNTPFVCAVLFGNFAAAREFLHLGASPAAELAPDDGQFPVPFRHSSAPPYADEYPDSEARTCLQLALIADYTEWTEKRQSPEAWKQERYAFIRDLVTCGGSIERGRSALGPFPLCIAAEKGLGAVIRLLIEFGSDVEFDGEEALLLKAARNLHTDAVRALLDGGATISMHHWSRPELCEAAWEAFRMGDVTDPTVFQRLRDVLVLMLERGALTLARNLTMRTPFSKAYL